MPYTARGAAYGDSGQQYLSIDDCNKSIALNPNHAMAYNNRGTAYFRLKQYERAIQDYKKALELAPDMKVAKDNLENCYKVLDTPEAPN